MVKAKKGSNKNKSKQSQQARKSSAPNSPGKNPVEKPKSTNYKKGVWDEEEKALFLQLIKVHGKNWKEIAKAIPTRSPQQIRSHAQKVFSKRQAKTKMVKEAEDALYDIQRCGGKMELRIRSKSLNYGKVIQQLSPPCARQREKKKIIKPSRLSKKMDTLMDQKSIRSQMEDENQFQRSEKQIANRLTVIYQHFRKIKSPKVQKQLYYLNPENIKHQSYLTKILLPYQIRGDRLPSHFCNYNQTQYTIGINQNSDKNRDQNTSHKEEGLMKNKKIAKQEQKRKSQVKKGFVPCSRKYLKQVNSQNKLEGSKTKPKRQIKTNILIYPPPSDMIPEVMNPQMMDYQDMVDEESEMVQE